MRMQSRQAPVGGAAPLIDLLSDQIGRTPVLQPAMARVSRWFMSHALATPHGMPTPSNQASYDAFPVRYGIEIEMLGVSLSAVAKRVAQVLGGTVTQRGAFHDELRVRDKLGRLWEVKPDSGAVEVASPILENALDLNMVQRIARGLQDDAELDASVGLHIHIDGKRFSPANLSQLMALLTRHESVLYNALQVRSERRDAFCQALRTHVVRDVIAAHPKTMDALQDIYHPGNHSRRFMGVNLENLRSGRRGTIEFRYFNATLDATEIGCHVGLVMALARRSLSTAAFPRVDAPEAPPSLPHMLLSLGFDPGHPVSRRLCGQWRSAVLQTLDVPTRTILEPALAEEGFAGDISFLLAHGIAAEVIFATVTPLDPAQRRSLFADMVTMSKWSADADYHREAFRLLARLPQQARLAFMTSAQDCLRSAATHGMAGPMLQTLGGMPPEEVSSWLEDHKHFDPDLLVALAPRDMARVVGILQEMHLVDPDFYSPKLFQMVAAATAHQAEALVKVGQQVFVGPDEAPEARAALICHLVSLAPPHIVAIGCALERVLHLSRCNHDLARVAESFCKVPMTDLLRVAEDLGVLYTGAYLDRRVGAVIKILAASTKGQIETVSKEARDVWLPCRTGAHRGELLNNLLRTDPARLPAVVAALKRILPASAPDETASLLLPILQRMGTAGLQAVANAAQALRYPGQSGGTLVRQVRLLADLSPAALPALVAAVQDACVREGTVGDASWVILCRLADML